MQENAKINGYEVSWTKVHPELIKDLKMSNKDAGIEIVIAWVKLTKRSEDGSMSFDYHEMNVVVKEMKELFEKIFEEN